MYMVPPCVSKVQIYRATNSIADNIRGMDDVFILSFLHMEKNPAAKDDFLLGSGGLTMDMAVKS